MRNDKLLSADSVTYQSLVGNGRSLHVPLYQRDYSWEEEQWEDLWNDLLDLRDEAAPPHYMGAVVMAATGEREWQIIDGQQRLATLSLLTLAVIQIGRAHV